VPPGRPPLAGRGADAPTEVWPVRGTRIGVVPRLAEPVPASTFAGDGFFVGSLPNEHQLTARREQSTMLLSIRSARNLHGTTMMWLPTTRFRDGPRAALLAERQASEQRRNHVACQHHEEPS
jgi:hypothetical protein